ncbi:MAG: glycogen debranching N-terminal domain-containing protein [Actinomycetota bacterium]|nr:amylo-alpha-1,6-glucosidase [Actinomycetota bacterium]
MARKAPPVTDIRDVQVIKHDRSFLLTDMHGDVPEGNTAALGLYHKDTRFLSRFDLTMDGQRPLLLHSSTERNYSQLVEMVLPFSAVDPQGFEHKENVTLSRYRLLGDALFERLKVANFGRDRRTIAVSLRFASDFLDLFEVRGIEREQRGQMQKPRVDRNQVELSYRGLDGAIRSCTFRFSPQPDTLTEAHAEFSFDLESRSEAEIGIEIVPQVGGDAASRRSLQEARGQLERDYSRWRKQCTRFKTSNLQLSRFLDRGILDLRMMLSIGDDGVPWIDAGVPWFSAMFGRDSLLTAYECMGVNPELAWNVLRGLAALQGKQEDDVREEEPGKILHEVRVGEMAAAGEIPHTPYFGSVDSTPLWLILLSYAYQWTDDLESVKALWPNALAALEWIDRYGDRDGDGYVEYVKRAPRGLDNQGWKDSHDAVVYPDRTKAPPPIALVEVQGYVYDAKRRMGWLARALGDEELAVRLDREAEDLKERFNRDFWMEKESYYGLALDGDKKLVTTITSNPGHCLWSGIVDVENAGRVARKLMGAALSSGWGIRTLAARQDAYDPIGYHTGSIWPHDNALIAHGLKLYGFDREAMQIIDQLSLAGAFFPLARYPELFCGFSPDEVPLPVEYPVACRPQAWASGAPFMMIRSYGGLVADAPNRTLYISQPSLPSWLEEAEIQGMRVGKARVDLALSQRGGVTAIHVPRKEGDLEILIRQ